MAFEGSPSTMKFYIGHHEKARPCEVDGNTLQHVQDVGFDMLTAPITSAAFHSRVLTVLSSYTNSLSESVSVNTSIATQHGIPKQPILGTLTPDDTSLKPGEGLAQLILLASDWIDLCSPDPLIADISRQVLALELNYASFCGGSNIMIQGPMLSSSGSNLTGLAQFSRAIQDALDTGPFVNIQICLPMSDASVEDTNDDMGNLGHFAREHYQSHPRHDGKPSSDLMGAWETWDTIRAFCKYNPRLSVALTMPTQAPPRHVTRRWFSEPVRVLDIPKSSFRNNKQGEPYLAQAQRDIISELMCARVPPWILLSNVGAVPGLGDAASQQHPPEPTPSEAASATHTSNQHFNKIATYLHYIRSLENAQPERPLIELFGTGYQDYLQNPLQPLTDNLESITYEVFEKDPIKYEWYEQAITYALRDWVSQKKTTSGAEGRVVVAVVGAGRGPLITRALQASQAAGVEIEMWAVEKNPNAFVLLQHHNRTKWNGRVHIVHSDMRSWAGPTSSGTSSSSSSSGTAANTGHIDILISELLGSFADNELSPECLDGVQHLLSPSHGISIPSSYTAHLTPIAAPKLHADISARITNGVVDAAEIPYVVMLHQIDYLSTLPAETLSQTELPNVQQVWEFSHPIPPSFLERAPGGSATASGNEHNRRFSRMEFQCQRRGVCNGLAGYFETILYQSTNILTGLNAQDDMEEVDEGEEIVELSTNPVTMDAKSRDMISWFPAYFPLKTPLYVPANSILVVSMWRQTDGRKVWYEWLVESYLALNNDVGQRIKLESSELHSSLGNACLM